MKKITIALVALLLVVSCGRKAEEGTHTHEDGTTHEDHAADTIQEEFDATDSTQHVHDSTDHDHSH